MGSVGAADDEVDAGAAAADDEVDAGAAAAAAAHAAAAAPAGAHGSSGRVDADTRADTRTLGLEVPLAAGDRIMNSGVMQFGDLIAEHTRTWEQIVKPLNLQLD